jgi:hypothetical protein
MKALSVHDVDDSYTRASEITFPVSTSRIWGILCCKRELCGANEGSGRWDSLFDVDAKTADRRDGGSSGSSGDGVHAATGKGAWLLPIRGLQGFG